MAELRGFKARGAWVALLAPPQSEIFKRAVQSGIETHPLDTSKPRYPVNALRLKRWLRAHDVQVVNTHSSRDGYLVGAAARLAGVPLLLRSRHIDVAYPNRWLSRHAFTTFAHHVLTTSQKITDHLKLSFQLSDDRISTLPTGIDLERFSLDRPKAELFADGNPDGLPVIGMVSVLRSWKGHPDFLQAARLLRERGVQARFVIVGKGPQRSNIEKKISELNLTAEVTLAGHREDVPAVLRALDILAMPSTGHEGIPQVVLQALACKTAVVGSDAGGIPEIIQPEKTGRIFPAGNAAALAFEIDTALRDTDVTRRMSENGRALVRRSHGMDHMLDRLEKIYAQYLTKDSAG